MGSDDHTNKENSTKGIFLLQLWRQKRQCIQQIFMRILLSGRIRYNIFKRDLNIRCLVTDRL